MLCRCRCEYCGSLWCSLQALCFPRTKPVYRRITRARCHRTATARAATTHMSDSCSVSTSTGIHTSTCLHACIHAELGYKPAEAATQSCDKHPSCLYHATQQQQQQRAHLRPPAAVPRPQPKDADEHADLGPLNLTPRGVGAHQALRVTCSRQ
jgi:hypothetical protein